MTNNTSFYIARHGQTEANVQKIMQGSQTDTPLTDVGRRQAQELGNVLKNEQIDLIITSPAQRAIDTASLIEKQLSNHIPIVVSEDIRERNMGEIDGKPYTIFDTTFSDAFEQYSSLSQEKKFETSLAGMESDKEVATRLTKYLKIVHSQHTGKTVLLVTHGGVIKSFLQYLGFATYDQLASNSVSTSGYIKVDFTGKEFRLLETKGVTKSKP